MKIAAAIGLVIAALAVALFISAGSSGLEKTGTQDEFAKLLDKGADGVQAGISALWG